MVFGCDECLSLGQQAGSGAAVVSCKLNHAARGKFSRGGDQLVHHVWIGGAQVLRVARITDHHWLAGAAAKPENLACDKLLYLLWGGIPEAKVLVADAVTSA